VKFGCGKWPLTLRRYINGVEEEGEKAGYFDIRQRERERES
jgi:hypothetical protein